MLYYAILGTIIVLISYAGRRIFQTLDRKLAQAALPPLEKAVGAVRTLPHLDPGYRTAGELSSDGALRIQSDCPKCQQSGRNYFEVSYHVETDRLRVQCGKRAVEGGVYNGCGAKWIELPGDAK